jgi:pimeloyl-ACP methyl ester carboxylesterase
LSRMSTRPSIPTFHRSRYRISRGCDAMVTHPSRRLDSFDSEDGAAMGRQSRYWLWLAFLLKLGFSAATSANADEASLIARQVPVGDRELYLVCAGSAGPGEPSVILISGYHDSSDPWTDSDALSLLPEASGPPVLQGLARNHLVCAYDRPGTLRYASSFPLTARSTPVAQPRTVRDLATELHALLMAAPVQRPYVLLGHSLGGLIGLAFALTYPADVRGLVFVDSFSPTLRERLGGLWPLYRGVLNPPAEKQTISSLRSAASETVDIDASIDPILSSPPLAPIPIAVLTKTEPFRITPSSLPAGITLADIDRAYEGAQDYFVALSQTTPHVMATGSEHYIQLSQPDLVIKATEPVISRVMAGSRR